MGKLSENNYNVNKLPEDGKGGMGSHCLMGTGFLFDSMESSRSGQ